MDPRPSEHASGIRALRPVILDRVRRMREEGEATAVSLCAAAGPLRGLVGRRWVYLAGGMLLGVVLQACRRRIGGGGPGRLL